MYPLRAALFDLDGTLVDSGLDFAAIRRDTGFPQGIGLLEHLGTLVDPVARAEAEAIIHSHEIRGAQRASWMPGARELLATLSDRGLPIGIVTRNSRHSASLMIDALAIPCDSLVAREDAPAKPDPAGLIAIASAWGVPFHLVSYTGDHRFDLDAARAAGMVACLYAPGGPGPFDGRSDVIVTDFAQWLDHFRLCPAGPA